MMILIINLWKVLNGGVYWLAAGSKSDKTTPSRVGSFDKGLLFEAKTAINEERRVRGSQQAKNYINWTSRREVVTTLMVEKWCKGTPLDTTISTEALYNNIHCNYDLLWLVASFHVVGINMYVIFEILRVVWGDGGSERRGRKARCNVV